jgi:hypothetical protein
MSAQADIHRRLLFIIHRGLVEIRALAQAGRQHQAFDLADALEPIPAWMARWKSSFLNDVRGNLQVYASKYPDAFVYIDYLEKFDPPEF